MAVGRWAIANPSVSDIRAPDIIAVAAGPDEGASDVYF
jgi:hypothetical protein